MTNNADVAMHLFAALHNMRSDRSNTMRELGADRTGEPSDNLKRFRAGEMAGLHGAQASLRLVEFPAGSTAVAEFEKEREPPRRIPATGGRRTQVAEGAAPGRARRRVREERQRVHWADREAVEPDGQMMRLKDGYVDQLMHLKELAWAIRQSAGDASNTVSNSLTGVIHPEALLRFHTNIFKARGLLAVVEEYTAGLPLPPTFKAAMDEAKRDVLGDEHTGRQLGILKAVLAGEKVNIDVRTWSPASIAKQLVLQTAAEIALQTAKDHLAEQQARARRSLIVQLGLLVLALAMSVVTVLVISRRIANPLLMLQKVMTQIAGGDFSVSLPKVERRDEIGQIISAFNTMVEDRCARRFPASSSRRAR